MCRPLLFVVCAALLTTAAPAQKLVRTGLDAGYYDMYNLDFAAAHEVFGDWIKAHPDDPLGPASDAAAFLFSEFDRLGVLDVELFTDDDTFTSRKKLPPDPKTRHDFEDRASQGERLARATLQKNPRDAQALYALTLISGLRSDMAAMIDKKDYAALKLTEQGSKLAAQTLASDPNLYDAHIAVGVENYMLALKPAVMRLFLFMRGDAMDKEEGIRQIRICAEKGHYLAPFARLMLAVTDLRAGNKAHAREMLRGLATEFPQNTLYRRQLDRIR